MMTEDTEILLERALHNELASDGWDQLEERADRNPALFEIYFRLARDQAALRALNSQLAQSVTQINLPVIRRERRWTPAASILICIITGFLLGRIGQDSPAVSQERGLLTADQHLEQYFQIGQEEGRILYELAPQVLEAKQSDSNDEFEVIVLRQIVERNKTPGLVTIERDEYGRAHGRLLAAHELPSPRSY